MKLLKDFDSKNYCETWKKYSRNAVRAIIIRNGKIALVKSLKEGFYKFPGGGMEDGETHTDTLIREVLEETGLKIIPQTIREFGMIREIRKSLFRSDEIFEQNSYYYFAEAEDFVCETNLTEKEKELGYVLEWTDIKTAFDIDMEIGSRAETAFLLREAYILELLL